MIRNNCITYFTATTKYHTVKIYCTSPFLAVVPKMCRFICTRVNCIFVDHFSSPPRPFLVRHNACWTRTYTQIETDVSNNSYGKSIKLHRRKCDFMVRLLNAEKQMMSGSTTGPPLNWLFGTVENRTRAFDNYYYYTYLPIPCSRYITVRILSLLLFIVYYIIITSLSL